MGGVLTWVGLTILKAVFVIVNCILGRVRPPTLYLLKRQYNNVEEQYKDQSDNTIEYISDRPHHPLHFTELCI